MEEGGVVGDDDDAGEIAMVHDNAGGLAIGRKLEGQENRKRVAGAEGIREGVRRSASLGEGCSARLVARSLQIFQFGARIRSALGHSFCDAGDFDFRNPHMSAWR